MLRGASGGGIRASPDRACAQLRRGEGARRARKSQV